MARRSALRSPRLSMTAVVSARRGTPKRALARRDRRGTASRRVRAASLLLADELLPRDAEGEKPLALNATGVLPFPLADPACCVRDGSASLGWPYLGPNGSEVTKDRIRSYSIAHGPGSTVNCIGPPPRDCRQRGTVASDGRRRPGQPTDRHGIFRPSLIWLSGAVWTSIFLPRLLSFLPSLMRRVTPDLANGDDLTTSGERERERGAERPSRFGAGNNGRMAAIPVPLHRQAGDVGAALVGEDGLRIDSGRTRNGGSVTLPTMPSQTRLPYPTKCFGNAHRILTTRRVDQTPERPLTCSNSAQAEKPLSPVQPTPSDFLHHTTWEESDRARPKGGLSRLFYRPLISTWPKAPSQG